MSGFMNPISSGKYRNDPCPCGSGKKIKKCHGVKTDITLEERNEINGWIQSFNKRLADALKHGRMKEVEKLCKGDLS